MTNREFDLLCIGFSIGSLSFLWLGYQLRMRVERWQARRSTMRARQTAKTTPFPSPGYGTIPSELIQERLQRRVIRDKPRVIPLERKRPSLAVVPDGDPSDYAIAPGWTREHYVDEIAKSREITDDLCQKATYAEAINALVSSGYKKVAAVAAVDACTLAERAGGLESWIAAAFRRAASK
jgi:hypothetical protein